MKFILSFSLLFLICCTGTQVKNIKLSAQKQKYLFIKNLKLDTHSQQLKKNGVYDEVNHGLVLALINQKSDEFKIIDGNAIVSLTNQATEKLLFSANDDENSLQKIGKSLGFTKLLDGELGYKNGKITLSVKKMGKFEDRYQTEDQIYLSFYRHQISYYTEQIAKRILNENYQIEKNPPDFVETKIIISEVSIPQMSATTAQSFSIPQMKFSTEKQDEITLFVNGLQLYINDANELLEEKFYPESLKKFQDVLSIIQEERDKFKDSQRLYLDRLNDDLEQQISSVTKTYHAKLRYETSILYQKRIENIDNGFKETKDLNLTILNSYAQKYKNLLGSYESLQEYKQKESIQKALSERKNNIGLRMIREKERQADQLYTSLKFNQAYEKYKIIEKDIQSYLVNDYEKVKEQIENKIKTLTVSAQSYIQSQIDPLLRLAEANQQRYILEAKMKQRGTKQTNPKFYKKKALSLMKKARTILNENNSLFLTETVLQDYNQTAELVNETVGDKVFSVGNFALLPLKYIANIAKGISDIFVLKFGWGLGAGAEAAIVGGGGLVAYFPAELSTAYTPQGKTSRISSLITRDNNSGLKTIIAGAGIQIGVCQSSVIRDCGAVIFKEPKNNSKMISYTNVNVWLGLGPAFMLNIETHRFVELFGVLLGQDWNITGNEADKTRRFHYFPYKKAKLFKKKE